MTIYRNTGRGEFNRAGEVLPICGTRNTRQPLSLAAGDLNGDRLIDLVVSDPGNAEVSWLLAADCGERHEFRRGDVDLDGRIDVFDAITTLRWVFLDGPPPGCLDAADTDDDSGIDVTDAILLLTSLFAGGGALPEPHGVCGFDPTTDDLTCLVPPECGK